MANQQNGNNSNRGFASMDPNKQRDIASEGGRASHASGNGHEFNSEEARRAGSQSHKNDGNLQSGNSAGNRGSGNSHEEHVRAGSQSHKNEGSQQSGGGTRGGSSEQHARAGSQSHKNDQR